MWKLVIVVPGAEMSGTQQEKRALVAGLIFLGLALAIIAAAYWDQRTSRRTGASSSGPQSNAAQADAASSNNSDAASQSAQNTTSTGESKLGVKDSVKAGQETKSDDPFDYGRTVPVKGDANPQVASVVEAVKTKSHGERLSVMLSPKPFNLDEYLRNPKAYLEVVEPGRAHMPHAPGPDVPRIQAAGPTRIKMKQGESVVLRAQVPAGMPCTYTSFDLGRFENELTTITVAAGESGIAETRFSATSGTIEDVHILCASPVMSGQLRFLVAVSK